MMLVSLLYDRARNHTQVCINDCRLIHSSKGVAQKLKGCRATATCKSNLINLLGEGRGGGDDL